MDPITLALLGIGVGTSLYNMYDKRRTEKDNQKQTEKLYQQSRRDSLEDFNRVNEYNSPRQQMIRLKEAGLNPNLVYGSGANMPAAKMDTPQQERYDRTPTPIDLPTVTGTLGEYARIRNINANTDNLAVQNEVLEQEKLVKGATLGKIMEETASTKFQRENAQKFQDTLFTKANLENQMLDENIKGAKMQQQIGAENIKTSQQNRVMQLKEFEMKRLQNSVNLQETVQDIIRKKFENSNNPETKAILKNQLQAIENSNAVNAWENLMRKKGIDPKDPAYIKLFQKMLVNIETFIKSGYRYY